MQKENLSAGNQNASVATPLWEFVHLSDYHSPKASGTSAARLKWASLKRFFLRIETENFEPLKTDGELQSLPLERLGHLVKEIDWVCVADAFEMALGKPDRISNAASKVKFVIGPPYAGHSRMLETWASRAGAYLIEPPSLEQILGSHTAWFKDWPDPQRLWVLPHLESCYLRHAKGLKLIRGLFEMASRGDLGNGIVGCDSWSWTYLQRVWSMPQWDALTLQAFDGARLTRLLFHLANDNDDVGLTFRNASNGKIIALDSRGEGHEISPELSQLAVYCRGNVGLARMYWRERLKAEPERQDDMAEKDQAASRLAQETQGQCVWVAEMPKEPVLPSEKDEEMAFIMHVLLLHNGLPEAILTQLLPFPHHRIMSLLFRLKEMGVVSLRHNCWRVAEMGYVSVREYLRSRDYILDGF